MQTKDIHESLDGKLWVGTINGLYSVDMKNASIKFYHEADGLPNAYIRGIEEDEEGESLGGDQ
jgi:ligand-binding sensor domain-containing protein